MVWQINGSCYTGGIDAHHATGWEIVGNVIEGFWCTGGLSEHGIHFWSESKDTLVEDNLIRDCDRGIGFGLGTSGHSGGIIRNNMISHGTGHGYSDVGISLENASGARVYNNTIYHLHSYPNAIEYRFTGSSSTIIKNNLVNRAIVSRDGGTAERSHNVTTAQPSWFVNASAGGNMHLSGRIAGVVDSGTPVAEVQRDLDGQGPEPRDEVSDLGADEINEVRSLPWLMLLRSD